MSQHAEVIRPATPADIPLILSLIRELAEYERAPDQARATPEQMRRHLFGAGEAEPRVHCLIAESEGKPAGFALYFFNFSSWTGRPGLYLEDLFVRPSLRGRGTGNALLRRLAGIALERGCARMEWSVINWNEPAIRFYKRLGAEPMSAWTVHRMNEDVIRRVAAG